MLCYYDAVTEVNGSHVVSSFLYDCIINGGGLAKVAIWFSLAYCSGSSKLLDVGPS